MINTLLAHPESKTIDNLKRFLDMYCPQVAIQGYSCSQEETHRLIESLHPDLLFIEKNMAMGTYSYMEADADAMMTTIVLSEDPYPKRETAFPYSCTFLANSFQVNELLMAVDYAQHWIRLRQEQQAQRKIMNQMLKSLCPNNLIAIPTRDGIEFLKAEEVIRCEGLQKYTLIIATEGRDFISSYNIGEYSKMLQCHGFFSTHKSHLINMRHIRKLSNEGTILMNNGSYVPLSRRRKRAFLDHIQQMN